MRHRQNPCSMAEQSSCGIVTPREPVVSIILCTSNRAGHLERTLGTIGLLEVSPETPIELLVVDNASTDQTKQIVAECAPHQIPTRYLWEPRRGLSRARNRGLRESSGNILVFTDDDVRPPPNWIGG